jgi:ferritin-like metal-binding protein YciE
MPLFTKDIKTMDDLFLHVLKDIYYAEKQILKALPDMVEKASNEDLKAAFSEHLGQTKEHVARLEKAFKIRGSQPKAVDCPAIDGILKEAKEVSGEISDREVLDAGLIAMAQAVEHYEITRYGTLIAWAKQLGYEDIADILSETLEEEHEADEKLTDLAEADVNEAAAAAAE